MLSPMAITPLLSFVYLFAAEDLRSSRGEGVEEEIGLEAIPLFCETASHLGNEEGLERTETREGERRNAAA